MKTIPLYLFLSYGISLSVFSQEKAETRFQGQKLNGSVKTLTETWHHIEKKFLHNHLSKPETVNLYLFDTKGNLTESLGISTDDSCLSNIFRYRFDSTGNATKTIHCNFQGKLLSEIQFRYDEYGNCIEMNQYDSSGNLYRKCAYNYISINILAKVTDYDEDSRVLSRSFPTYGLFGNLCGWSSYDSAGILQNKVDYKYDEQGRKSEQLHYHSSGAIPYKTVYEYNDKGETVELVYGIGKDLFERNIYRHDKFDQEKNWCRERAYECGEGEPIYIIKRDIEYY